MKKYFCLVILTLASLTLFSCSQKDREAETLATDSSAANYDGATLVLVNGEEITEADVETMINRTFSVGEQLSINEEVQQKVLESLIASKAMKQRVSTEMSAYELHELKQKVSAYEEELFIQEYMSRHVTPEPVTTAMVQQYYEEHPERFGGGKIKIFEMLTPDVALDEKQRDRLLASAQRIREAKNWQQLAQGFDNEFGLRYASAKANPNVLDKNTLRVVSGLSVDETSAFIFENQVPVIYRVTGEEVLTPKPLAEVSTEIRKMLAPVNLRKAVKKVTTEVIAEAKVEYPMQSDE